MPSLLMLKGDKPGQQVSLESEKNVLGRNPDCHVVIGGTAVSREHAIIHRVNGRFFIEDNKSRNGTYVNEKQITGRIPLRDNDQIKICDFIYKFHDQVTAEEPPPPARPTQTDMRDTFSDIVDAGPETPEPAFRPEASLSHSAGEKLLETAPADKLRLLLEITNGLSRSVDLDALLGQIVDRLFQMFRQADRGFVILLDPVTGKYVPKVIKTRRATAEGSARFSRTIVKQCMESVEGFLSEDASNDRRIGLSESIVDFRIRSVMCAPLWGQDEKAFGVIQLDTQDRSKKFIADDLDLLMAVARQASIALENAKLHEDALKREKMKRDLELASQVQRGFLPKHLPVLTGYDFYANYEPAQEVGGDYYDFIPLANGRIPGAPPRLGILIGDVAGKGVPAALLMGKLNSDARFCMLTEPDPATAVNRLNDLLGQAGLMDRFDTLAAAVLDPATHTVTLVNAGHMAPLWYRASNGELLDAISSDESGIPLGVMDGYPYDSCQIQLEPGDCLILFTDGVNEAMNVQDKLFELQGIYDTVRSAPGSPAQLGERIMKAVKRHSANRSQNDDITLVTFGRLPGTEAREPVQNQLHEALA